MKKYSIVIHDDNLHYFHLLVKTLMHVFRYNKEYSEYLVQQLHKHKEVMIWSGVLEQAEYKIEELRKIEPEIHGSLTLTNPIPLKIIRIA